MERPIVGKVDSGQRGVRFGADGVPTNEKKDRQLTIEQVAHTSRGLKAQRISHISIAIFVSSKRNRARPVLQAPRWRR